MLADLVRGKKVVKALEVLSFTNKRAAEPVVKLINSAVANAKQHGADVEKLFIKSIAVDKGIVLKRFMPRARGSAAQILKRASHISVELGSK